MTDRVEHSTFPVGFNPSALTIADVNNDGFLDIFFTNGAAIPSLEKSDPSYSNRLFRNNGDGTFTDVTETTTMTAMPISSSQASTATSFSITTATVPSRM